MFSANSATTAALSPPLPDTLGYAAEPHNNDETFFREDEPIIPRP